MYEIQNLIIEVISCITLLGIVLGFAMAATWNIKYLIVAQSLHSLNLRVQYIIAQSVIVVVYGIILIRTIVGDPMEFSIFAGIVLRPSLAYLGFTQAAIARQKYLLAKKDVRVIRKITQELEKIK